MKKTYTILLIFFTLLSNAQTLEYNRTIDTLLAITIPSGTVFDSNNFWIMGDYMSVPANKVWKVQSLMILAPGDEEENNYSTTLYYNNGSPWGNLNSITGKIVIMLKNAGVEEALFSRSIPQVTQTSQGENYINSPFWLSQSDLGIAFRHSENSTEPYLIVDYTAYVHVSILEFNE